MDRREALKTLLALPAVRSLAIAEVRPTDVIVVECDEVLRTSEIDHIHAQLALVWPDRKIVVFDKGLHLRIARNTVAG